MITHERDFEFAFGLKMYFADSTALFPISCIVSLVAEQLL